MTEQMHTTTAPRRAAAAARVPSSISCCKGAPARRDVDLAARLAPQLHGRLHGALTAERVCCARRVVGAVKARGLPKHAAVITITTTIVESTIRNLTGGDRDSVGLFQQRASWGSFAQRTDPAWATDAFLDALQRKFPGGSWQTVPVGVVCQKVQVSAFPDRYQPEAADAAVLVEALWGGVKSRPRAATAGHRPETGGTGVKVNPGVKVGRVGGLLVRILGHYPKVGEIYITSAYRKGARDHHGGLTYQGSPTAAVDIGAGGVNPEGSRRLRDVAKWLYDTFADLIVEEIHTTPYNDDRGFYVKHQRKNPGGSVYGAQLRAQHRDHVHFATSEDLAHKILARLGDK